MLQLIQTYKKQVFLTQETFLESFLYKPESVTKTNVNPCGADPVHRRDFRKILPFLHLLLSLHLYTKWICGFDSPLNFEETGAKKVP